MKNLLLKVLLKKQVEGFYKAQYQQRMGYYPHPLEQAVLFVEYDELKFTLDEIVKVCLNHIALERKGHEIVFHEVINRQDVELNLEEAK